MFDAPDSAHDAKGTPHSGARRNGRFQGVPLLQRLGRIRTSHEVGPELCPFVPMCAAAQKFTGFDEMVALC
jgi:hypothetical protein